ncbi:FtsX-like permease family protein [Romboutsia timonensis]|uniref:FtsX-like permease family protein n=1 Tax=Romboutsia timonensis TaxID=1776391 RepID=UPI002A81D747|nr:FtsX-like permease family protein [Romboutsia timonensis]MDY3959170.1 FtsX-like permease family protein [Romboutsia timonensis]
MYSKIALKNVKKSIKDYTIYFLTLTLAVCIFYSFNSIESQKAIIENNNLGSGFVEALSNVMYYVSAFVAFILGGLILYANNFLIKKRNKEMGIYMTLGMSKNKISKILILETLIVGGLSLLGGLIIGVLVSQVVSVLVANLFDLKGSGYVFTISIQAILKTILYFGVMFILVMIFNSFVISKYKIIDLLSASRKTEEIKFKNPIVYVVTFIVCVISLAIAYAFVLKMGVEGISEYECIIPISLLIIGTILFFFSLAGFILYVVKKNKNVYFKGLNIFVIKQINSKVNTNFMSMSVICLMLFLTINMLSTGFSFKNAIESGLEKSTPFDASAYMQISPYGKDKDIKKFLDYIGFKFDKNDKVAYYNEYRDGKIISDIIPLNDDVERLDYNISYIKISDYNKMREIRNEEPIDLNKDEVLITSNLYKLLPSIEKYMKNNNAIKMDGKTYYIKNKEVIKENLKTDYTQNNIFTLVVNDELCNNMNIFSSNVSVNFVGNDKDIKAADFDYVINSYRTDDIDYDELGLVMANTRNQIYEENKGTTSIILFIGIYMGLVFLISSMAILALQQLSEASDSIERYKSLKRLGVSTESINKTIFVQTLIYFSVPVALAVVHSVVGIAVSNDFISMYNQPDIVGSSLITAGIFFVIYMIYFYITYSGYKNIVKNNI